jgi:hypothetical protein
MSQHTFRNVLVVVAAAAVVGVVGLASLHLTSRERTSSPRPAAAKSGTRGPAGTQSVTSPTPSPSPVPSATPSASPATGKSGPPSPPSSSAGKYPYPMDAGGNVVRGTLTLSPAQVPAGAGSQVTVAADQGGWLAGQEIFVYLGQRYELTIPGGGASGELQVPAGSVGSTGVVVSGFQFPDNNPALPIDGFGTATLRLG